MQKLMKSLIVAFAYMSMPIMAQKTDLVNPIIGTNGMGHTFPGACAPFGIVQVSPDTDTIPHNIDGVYQPRVYEYCAGYQHKDSSIVGFSHTHFSGTGHSDLGDILLMPFTGKLQINPGTADNPDSGYSFPIQPRHRNIPSRLLRSVADRRSDQSATDSNRTDRYS